MRITHRYIQWDSHLKVIKPIRDILDRYNISHKYKEDLECVIPAFNYSIEFYLNEDNPNFANLKIEIDRFKIEPQTATIYEKSDLAIAEWFVVSTGQYQNPQPEDSYLEKTFDLENYCHLCGIGQVQNAPFRLKTEPKQYNNQFWGLYWEYFAMFVRQETRDILEKATIQVIRFSQPDKLKGLLFTPIMHDRLVR